jgi:catechol 2,3-dioxygenase-like lactoylglutathione lyase family enzyme
MRVGGILETALYVADIKRTAEFYRRLFGFPTLLETERLIALDVAGRSVLLLFAAGGTTEPFPVAGGDGIIPPHGGAPGGYHFAFSIAAEDVEPWRRHLEAEGVAVESAVTWPGGAKSLYFRDPDGNLAELIGPGFWAIY